MTETKTQAAVPAWPMPRSCPLLPPDQYSELREGPPRKVRLDDGTTPWIVSRYEDLREAMRNPALSADFTRAGYPRRLPLPPVPRSQSFLRMDPPEHTRLRRMVVPELSRAAVRAYRPFVCELVDHLLDDLATRPRPVDLMPAFSTAIPELMIARILGVPESDAAEFQEQNVAMTSCGGDLEAAMKAFADMGRYLDELVRAKEAAPTDDMTSRLASQYVATGELDHDDLVAMVLLLLVAGQETTSSQLTLGALTLMRRPHEVELMLDRPERMEKVVEELLRYWSIVQDDRVRVATEETELGGVPICPGEGVVFAISAANHDESVYPDAAEFRPDRDARQHLAFGHGPHFCPGAELAKMEMEVALPALFGRFPGLRLGVAFEDLTFRYDTVVYGLNELPVTW